MRALIAALTITLALGFIPAPISSGGSHVGTLSHTAGLGCCSS